MPNVPIDISKGVYKNADSFEISDSGFATEFKNLLLTDARANVDRPGLSSFASMGLTNAVIGMTYFGGYLVAVTDNRRIWKITSAGVVSDVTGTSNLGGTSRPVFATDGTYLAIAGGGAPKTWTGTGNFIDMTGSPPNTKFVSYLDGYWILQLTDDQEFRFAGPTSLTRATWNSSDFFSAEGLPDNLVSQAVLLRELYGFGEDSLEIFQNFGNTSSPFQRTFFVDRGIIAPYSVVQADNTLGWLSRERGGDRQFVALSGRTPAVLSGPYDRVLQQFDTVDDCFGARLDIEGFHLVAWVFPTEARCFIYDYKNREWVGEWDGWQHGDTTRFKMNAYTYVKDWNQHFVGDFASATIYQISREFKADGANVLKRIRRFNVKHKTGARKRSNYYLLDIKRGVGTPGSDEPVIEMRVNDDNRGWTEPVRVGLGYPGELEEPIRVQGLRGVYRRRQVEVTMTDPSELNLVSLEENVDLLGS